MQALIGWKQIAQYLRCGVRTVQRWEALGLPVHRPAGKERGSVMAVPEELDAWSRSTPLRYEDELIQLQQEIERLKAELQVLRRAESRRRTKAPLPLRAAAVRGRVNDELQKTLLLGYVLNRRASKTLLLQQKREQLESRSRMLIELSRARRRNGNGVHPAEEEGVGTGIMGSSNGKSDDPTPDSGNPSGVGGSAEL